MTTAPEAEWFRPPTLRECCPHGDSRRFLWVAEPVRGEGVYGVGYRVSMSDEMFRPDFRHKLENLALAELDRRIAAGDKHGEGCLFEVFEWNPVLIRDEAGNISVAPETS